MDGSTAKRLFRAIADAGDPSLVKLCRKIAKTEAEKGRTVLAQRLNEILSDAGTEKPKGRGPSAKTISSLGEFALASDKVPKSRRFKDPLVQLIPRERLRHHIVLSPEISARYDRIIKEYAGRHRLAKHGLNHKKKVLIYGPPGCGKTLSAEYLAWHTGLPLIKVRFDALISSYFGESAANLRRVFEWAANTPSVLFLDECDFIAKSRTSGNDIGEVARLVNTLLLLLEEYDSPGLLLAATNLTDTLDKALYRRFDEVFEVTKPSIEEVIRLLELTLTTMKLDTELDLQDFAKSLVGMSASSIVSLSRDAAATAVLDGHSILKLQDLEAALARLKTQFAG